ncbi:MAG: arginase family protein [Gammaproteobacteria bacterium]|nr:arginase family protein [Gammaproteobacteria bacterium]
MSSQFGFSRSGLLALITVLLPFTTEVVLGQWPVPEELRAAFSALNEEQAAFIASGEILEFIPERQLEHELATRDAGDLQNFVDDLMSLAAEMVYDQERDMGAAPLNLTSRGFNRGTMPTPAPLREPEREPGPFSVHRYLFPQSGVPTFGGTKVAIWPEDLIAGNVDVAIVGVPSNMSSGRRDSVAGPDAMRALDTIATPDIQSLVKPFEVLSVVDYGYFSVDYMSVERSVDHVTDMVAETARTGAVPMLVGGDTSMLYPGVKGIAEVRGAARFGLLHFSAHPDAERSGDHTVSDRQALYLLLDQGVVEGTDTIQVGLRGPDVDVNTLQWLRDKGVRYHTMAEIRQRGFETVLKRVQREVDRGPDAFFVSIDVSAIDSAEMVAAGRATANGMRLGEVTRMIRHVCASKEIVGFEITDLAPMLDVSLMSVMHANAVLNACIIGIALRKEGLDPGYVHPLALDHGQR